MALTKISGSILKDPLNLGEVSIGGTLTYQDVTNVDSVGIITARAGINVSGGQLDVGSNIKIGNAGVITATSFSGSGANLTSLPAANLTGTLPSISGANLTNLPVQASISSNANNRVITGGGGSNLVGEQHLTFDGSHLIVGNGKGIRANYIRPTDMSNTNTGGASQQYWKIGDISLNGSEAAEITLLGSSGYSSGNAQYYGKTTIILRGSNGNTLLGSWWVDGGESSHYSDVRWKYTSGTTYELWISAGAYNNIAAFVKTTGTFDNSNAAGTGTNNAPSGSTALQQTHYKSIGTIHTIQYTSTHTRFLQNIKMDSGKGIDFTSNSNASGVSSEILDDYEEGSWTPVLQYYGGGTFQNVTMTTYGNLDTPRYTKIGRLVHATFNWTGFQINGSHLAYPRVTGLPFTSTAYGSAVVSYHNCFGTTQTQGAWLANGQVSFEFYVNGGSWNTWNGSSNRYFQVSCTYQAT